MHAYLVQHAEALSSETNPLRPLSDKGREDARRMGEYLLRHADLHLSDVLHSGRERAGQTAELMAESFGVPHKPAADLKPSDDPSVWAQQLSMRTSDVMLVGHLPHLQRLAGLLLCNDEEVTVIRFHNGGVVALERDAVGDWHIDWALTPLQLPS